MENSVTPSPHDRLVDEIAGRLTIRYGQMVAFAGRSWGGLKKAVEALGVGDDDQVSVEYDVMQGGSGFVLLDEDDGVKSIKEIR